jgi:acetyl-CoA carboxylase biotin carboxylase subunit
MKLFKKILIANRGEIAVRVIKSAWKLGIETVAVYSEVDEDSLHVRYADEAYCIGEQELSETYLNIDKIMEVAVKAGCDAIHPGYGFLAENPLLVDACEKSGITFIGPHTRAMQVMGNKIEARAFVKEIGIPMTEGITGTPAELAKNIGQLDYPVLVKAAAGGGGKGMRIVYDPSELEEVLESTAREAKNYFGDGTIYIEKYVEEPRHIEFQIIGDKHGKVIHLFDRECTIQRRYQKIIEESPSPTLTEELRAEMGDAAVAIGKAIEYNSAGTIEFLVDKHLKFYFLEMNTRIQVEHPVTEMVTGVDLVEEQILVAAGNPLRLSQDNLRQNGHAVECRIYAEDPANNFLPSPGKMTLFRQPEGDNIRIDSAIDRATTIQSFFDPMISKLVVWGEDRSVAIEKSISALKQFDIHGIKTNIPYLLQLLQHKAFIENRISTKFCDEHTDEILESIEQSKLKTGIEVPLFAYLLYSLNYRQKLESENVWQQLGYWRNIMEIPFEVEGENKTVVINGHKEGLLNVTLDNNNFEVCLKEMDDDTLRFRINDRFYNTAVSVDEKGQGYVSLEGHIFNVKRLDVLIESEDYATSSSGSGDNNLFAPMPGKVIKVNVKEGDEVTRGTILVVVEAMKMENNIIAVEDAVVEKVPVKEGDMVDTNVQLVFLKENNE